MIWLLISLAVLLQSPSAGASKVLASNYDGTNSLNCALYYVGKSFSYTYSEGARFQVSGSGEIKLKRMILPLAKSEIANANNYKLSIVRDDRLSPGQEVIWFGIPQDVGPTVGNYSYALNGIVQGGQNYWLLFEATAADVGYYLWPFASSPLLYCGQDRPPDSGYVASRWSTNGPPTGFWHIWPNDIRPAFLIEGNHVPEAAIVVSPLAEFPGLTNLIVIAPNNQSTSVVLDGSESKDADNDQLQFTWLDDTNLLATTLVATNILDIGTRQISLVVSDGSDSTTASVMLNIITLGQAVEILILLVEQADLADKNRRPMIATLINAVDSFDRGNSTAALNQLRSFQNKVQAQIAGLERELANQLMGVAQQIIDRSEGL
ncbi:MAG: hypothetical protein HY298_08815 [Verrucomicrobia bacterium]|nr:hypothetical protein [Verrucomicrobiota bacterium]